MRRVLPFLLIALSCSKPHDSPAPPRGPQTADSLFSWKVLRDTTGPRIGIIDVWFVDAMKGFFAGEDRNLYQSPDGGKTWTQIPNATSPTYLSNLFFVNAQYGFAQASGNLEVTHDGGATWSVKGLATTNNLNVFFTSSSTGFVGDVYQGLYKTTDTGNTWIPVYHHSGGSSGYYPYFLDDNFGFVFDGSGFIDSTHSGAASWRTVAQTLAVNSSPAFNTLQYVDSLNGFYGSRSGVLKTDNGGFTWNTIHPNGGEVNIVKFFNANTGYSLVDSVIYKTVNGGQTWSTSCRLTRDEFNGMHFINPTTGWVCTQNGFIFQITQ